MKRSQLNAISRHYATTRNDDAMEKLEKVYGIDFYEYARKYGWKGSAYQLVSSLEKGSKKALGNVYQMNGFTASEDLLLYRGCVIRETSTLDASAGRNVYTITDESGDDIATLSDRITTLFGCRSAIDNHYNTKS